MHHRDVAAGAMNLERRFGRGVLAADDDDALAVVLMRFLVEVRDVRQILAGMLSMFGCV
jgi:membrane protein DedA with SNARE-associated domain